MRLKPIVCAVVVTGSDIAAEEGRNAGGDVDIGRRRRVPHFTAQLRFRLSFIRAWRRHRRLRASDTAVRTSLRLPLSSLLPPSRAWRCRRRRDSSADDVSERA